MLENYFNDLQDCIACAHHQDDLEILFLAKERMNKLLLVVNTLPVKDQVIAQQHIDMVLPMEWPLWMEACRYNDLEKTEARRYLLQ